jgi:hypothetical protein
MIQCPPCFKEMDAGMQNTLDRTVVTGVIKPPPIVLFDKKQREFLF